MKAQIEFPDFVNILTALITIAETLKEISSKLDAEKHSDYSEWLTASDFCKKYHISRPTLYKRVKQGIIEACNLGGDVNRYRMKGTN